MKTYTMPPKRSLSLGESSELKKKRKMLTVNEKVGLLDKLKAGNSYASVARQYGLTESTVRYIKKEEKNIRKTAAISFTKDAKRVVNTQNKTMVRMENALVIWIHDFRAKKISLDAKHNPK